MTRRKPANQGSTDENSQGSGDQGEQAVVDQQNPTGGDVTGDQGEQAVVDQQNPAAGDEGTGAGDAPGAEEGSNDGNAADAGGDAASAGDAAAGADDDAADGGEEAGPASLICVYNNLTNAVSGTKYFKATATPIDPALIEEGALTWENRQIQAGLLKVV